MGISDTSCMIYGLPLLYWHWNLGKSGQGSTLRNMLNAYDFVNPGLQNLIHLWII